MCNGAVDINERHAFVEINACRITENKGVDGFAKAAGPGLFLGMQGIVGIVLSLAHGLASS